MTEQAGAAGAEGTESTGAGTQEVQDVKSLPEWAQNKITDLNREAAKYRTAKNEAETRVREAVAAEFEAKLAEVNGARETVEANLSTTQLEVVKLRAAFGAVLPEDQRDSVLTKVNEFTQVLQGSNEDEINQYAARLSGLFGGSPLRTPAVDRSPEGGDPAMALNGDPLTQSLKSALGIN
ncbi:hypothetical protein [Amycolatopsis lexingtonensis]|uniref:hypothetical protein n=1 Tax=Amycolatopsis lexingtonensis TaxID=218822 RepID=UPI003F72EC9D